MQLPRAQHLLQFLSPIQATSCPCSSVSLGKFEMEYTPSKNGKIVGSSSNNHTLVIPESKLVWSGKNRAAGSLMLVFHARASTGQKSQKRSLQQSLAKVSVELNRMNPSDIVQLTKTKHAVQTSSQDTSATYDGSEKVPRSTQSASDFNSQQAAMFGESINGSPLAVESHGSLDGVAENSAVVGTYSKMGRKTKSKMKERRDACIMTDLSLGTGETISPTQDHTTCIDPLEHGLAESNDDPNSMTPPLPKKGFTENGASLLSKLAAQCNGMNSLNGLNFLNGFADDHQSMTTDHSISRDDNPTFLDSNESNYSLTVSIPCTYRNRSRTSSTSCLSMDTSNHTYSKRRYKVPARKRSEIQLLLDGDKPPGQRISAEEIPVFTAEDPSNRATRYMIHQSKGSWTQLGTGTRKITPVEPFTYPFSPTLIPKKLSGIKRSLSESDAPLSSDVSSPPPKMPRVAEMDEEKEEKMEESMDEDSEVLETQDMDVKTTGAVSQSVSPPPTPPPPNVELTDEKSRDFAEQATGVAPEGLFCAEIVVFDSRGECLLDKGEYSILMHKCPQKSAGAEPPPLVTFAPLSWSSIFGGGEQVRKGQACASSLLHGCHAG